MPWAQGHPWSNEITLEFIEQYGKETCLWDPSNPKHNNRTELFHAWERIRNALKHHYDFSTEDLKRKKEALFVTFRLSARRKRNNPNYVPSWFCYEALERFLGPLYLGEGNKITNTRLSCDAKSRARKIVTRPSTSSPDDSATLKNIKRAFDHETPTPSMEMNSDYNIITPEEYDDCDLFGKLLARKLRKLNEHHRDLAMHEIDNIMFEATKRLHQIDSSEFAITGEDHKVENNYDNVEYLEENVEE